MTTAAEQREIDNEVGGWIARMGQFNPATRRNTRKPFTHTEREFLLALWGDTPAWERAEYYIVLEGVRQQPADAQFPVPGIGYLDDIQVMLLAFAPNDLLATEAVERGELQSEDRSGTREEWYRQNVTFDGDPHRAKRRLLDDLAAEGKAGDPSGEGVNRLSLQEQITGVMHGPMQNVFEQAVSSLVEDAAAQDRRRVPTLLTTADKKVNTVETLFEGAYVLSSLAVGYGAAAPAVFHAAKPPTIAALKALTGATVSRWAQITGSNTYQYIAPRVGAWVNPMRSGPYRTLATMSHMSKRPVMTMANNLAANNPNMGRVGQFLLRRAQSGRTVASLGTIFSALTLSVATEWMDPEGADLARLEQQKAESEAAQDAAVQQAIDVGTEGLDFSKPTTVVEAVERTILELQYALDMTIPWSERANSLQVLFFELNKRLQGQALLDEQRNEKGSTTDEVTGERGVATGGVTGERGIATPQQTGRRVQTTQQTPGGVSEDTLDELAGVLGGIGTPPEPIDETTTTTTAPSERFPGSPYNTAPMPPRSPEEQEELIEKVAAGEVGTFEIPEFFTEYERQVHQAMENTGAYWFDPDTDVPEDIYNTGGFISEDISNPATNEVGRIVIPPELGGVRQFFAYVDTLIEDSYEVSPFIGVDEDFRALVLTPKGDLNFYEAEFLAQRQPGVRSQDIYTATGDEGVPIYREDMVDDILQSMSPVQIFKLQDLARDALFYGEDRAPSFAGHISHQDMGVINVVMGLVNKETNAQLRSFWPMLDHLAGLGRSRTKLEERNKPPKPAFSIPGHLRHIPGEKTIAEDTKNRFRRKLGRDPRQDELAGVAKELTGYHDTSVREQIALYLAAWEGDNQGLLTGGALKRIEDPGAATDWDIGDEWANEIDLNKRRETNSQSYGRMLNATLGGRASLAGASAAGGVTRIGRGQ